MTKLFTPKLYLLGHEYTETVERIFGKENVQMQIITPTSKFADKTAQQLSELALHQHDAHKSLLRFLVKLQIGRASCRERV